MILSNLLGLLLNKYVLGSLAVLISLIMAYFKGHAAATKSAEEDRILAEAAQQSRLRAAAAKNQFLEKKGEQTNETISSTDSISDLLKLWSAFQSGQDQSNPSDKNPK